MLSDSATINCWLTEEEMQQIEDGRERKAREIKEKLRISRNEEAETIQNQLEQGIEGVNKALRTLTEEIALREAELKNGDRVWRREDTSKSVSLAEKGFKAAKVLQKLCVTVKIGLGTLATLADMGIAYEDNHAYEGSATLMAVCRGSPVSTRRDLRFTVEEMREVELLGLWVAGDVEEEKVEGKKVKRKRG